MNAIYKFYVDYGRHGDLSGVFVAEQEDVKNLIGKEIYFGEVLGKHSEVILKLKEEHLTEVTTDEKFIELFEKYDLSNGYNPFDYYEENEEDEE
jgi:hypothetical protein